MENDAITLIYENWEIIFTYGLKLLHDCKKELAKIAENLSEHHARIMEIEIRDKIRREAAGL